MEEGTRAKSINSFHDRAPREQKLVRTRGDAVTPPLWRYRRAHAGERKRHFAIERRAGRISPMDLEGDGYELSGGLLGRGQGSAEHGEVQHRQRTRGDDQQHRRCIDEQQCTG